MIYISRFKYTSTKHNAHITIYTHPKFNSSPRWWDWKKISFFFFWGGGSFGPFETFQRRPVKLPGSMINYPPRKLTYPLPFGPFEGLFFLFPFGGICMDILQGNWLNILLVTSLEDWPWRIHKWSLETRLDMHFWVPISWCLVPGVMWTTGRFCWWMSGGSQAENGRWSQNRRRPQLK